MVSKVKITVLRRMSNPDLWQEYLVEGLEAEPQCEWFQEGQEFIVDIEQTPGFMVGMEQLPKGFCAWAWAAIEKEVAILALGGNAPWIREEGVFISCCTDGLRPVVFKLERV